MRKLTFFTAITVLLAFSSCKKDMTEPIQTAPSNMNEMVVPQGFDWKTSKNLEITITAPTGGIVEASSTDGRSYQRAFLKANQPYTMKLSVPTYEKKLTLSFAGQQITLELTTQQLSHRFQ